MLKYNDSMDHYDEDIQSFTQSGRYQAMHTRNNEEIELFREQLPDHMKAYFTSLLNHLSDEYACLAEALTMLILNELFQRRKPMKNRIQKRQKASENQNGIH